MNELIKEAHDNLKIDNVRLRSSEIKLNDRLRPEQLTELQLTSQSFSGVQAIASGIAQSEDSDSANPQICIYTFRYAVGVRLVTEEPAEHLDEDSDVDAPDEDPAAVEIRATFDAEYFSQNELDEVVLKEFAKSNVGYHVWPYWRELVQSAAGRMCIPHSVLSVPFYFVPAKQQKESGSQT